MSFWTLLFGKNKTAKVTQKVAAATRPNARPEKTNGESKEGRFEYASSLLDKGPDGYFIEPEDSFDLEIVGESFYQDNLTAVAGPKAEKGVRFKCRAQLVCDRNNPKDKYAVSVHINGLVVGHLSKTDAREWRKTLKEEGAALEEVTVSAVIVGGWKKIAKGTTDEGSFGVKLDVPVVD